MITYDNELENVTLCYSVLKKCALSKSDNWQIEYNVGRRYTSGTSYDEGLEAFRDIFLEPFYDYLDERIDDQGFILSTLIRYKHKCEWFLRQELYELWCKNKSRGEMKLAQHLYQYLYDQGIDFYVEPASVSGEADMVSAQTGEERLIADAKIFNSEKSKTSIAKWYRQIYTYTLDFNEPFGYLVIFKTCEHDLSFSFPEKSLQTHFFSYNNKTVFFVVIDIFPYKESASKRDKLKSTVITGSNLVQILDNDLDS